MIGVLLIAGIAALPPATPETPGRFVQTTTAAEEQQLAREIAEQLNPAEPIRVQLSGAEYRAMLRKVLEGQSGFPEMEKSDPGIIDAMLDRAHPLIVDLMMAEFPTLMDDIAPIYLARMSGEEMRTALAFYRSPPGRAFVDATNDGAMKRATARADIDITRDELLADTNAAGMVALSKMNSADRSAVLTFGVSPIGKKMGAVAPDVAAAVVRWTAQPRPDLEVKVGEAMIEAAGTFLEKGAGQ